jgi:hypothetical protein
MTFSITRKSALLLAFELFIYQEKTSTSSQLVWLKFVFQEKIL